MGIAFFNNWTTSEEFHLIEISYTIFQNPTQLGITFCILGVGVVLVFNK